MSTPQWRSVTSNIDRTALSASLAMVAANLLWPTLVMDIAPYLLLAGMVFPGIPHGAVDNLLDLEPESRQNIMIFLTRYVSLMVAMLLIWLVSPSNGLALFILYSGWHFGESDLRRLGGFRSFPALISGTTLLLAMLCSHPQEIRSYLLAFGIPAESVADRTFWYTAAASFLIFLLNGLRSAGINRMKLLLLAAT
ncbi:MAG: Brp/Blh family beta-carotene 15,15'-dioxygenase, partial [Bacteroidota bacterium]